MSRRRPPGARTLFDPAITRRAIKDASRKLDPRTLAKPGHVHRRGRLGAHDDPLPPRLRLVDGDENVFAGLVALWLWFTVLFANFAEAMAEGRGKAQAATLRKTRAETVAHVRRPDGAIVEKPSSAARSSATCAS